MSDNDSKDTEQSGESLWHTPSDQEESPFKKLDSEDIALSDCSSGGDLSSEDSGREFIDESLASACLEDS
jgi:hypothetical protein